MKPSELFGGGDFEVYDLLYCLGITVKYKGFFYTAYAVQLAIQQPERLLHVTKWLYPDIAKRYGTSYQAVERSIRTVIHVAWNLHPELLEEFACHRLSVRPTATKFLSIVTWHLLRNRAA